MESHNFPICPLLKDKCALEGCMWYLEYYYYADTEESFKECAIININRKIKEDEQEGGLRVY